MRYGGEVDDEGRRDGAGTGGDVQGGGSDSATLQEQGLGINGGDAEFIGGVPPVGGP